MPTSPDPHSQYITHPSGETSHIIVDDFADPWKPRETVLLQGGFARHAAFFHHWVPALSRQYRVVRRDLRGHGYSSAPARADKPAAYTLDAVLADIVDTLDQLGVDRVHFFGESTSGMLGMILAARHPERVRSLTVCSSPTHLPPATQGFLAMGRASWPEACRALGSRGWGQELAKLGGTMSSADDGYRRWWLEQLSVSSGEGLASYAEFLCTLDARPYLGRIKVPMLILAPTRSAATKIEEQKEVQAQVPGSKLVPIDGAGHEIYVDSAEECQNVYREFLAALP
ncbi:Alpha/Beta hydrolase protein [Lineolata rhizophorae]|uniref:Alpha/Beta hydrolase protein n=1 Tax=Lineolata rhizophorae TaxID=578093 RepID=A0A6A6PF55_9PEZI|nr:Alpha/Beta hydrolase protein [Lineolata rhizophorae]